LQRKIIAAMDRAKAAGGPIDKLRNKMIRVHLGTLSKTNCDFLPLGPVNFADARPPGLPPIPLLRRSETLRPARATARFPAARLPADSGHCHDARYTVITNVSATVPSTNHCRAVRIQGHPISYPILLMISLIYGSYDPDFGIPL
jgi:hypothetical protein